MTTYKIDVGLCDFFPLGFLRDSFQLTGISLLIYNRIFKGKFAINFLSICLLR